VSFDRRQGRARAHGCKRGRRSAKECGKWGWQEVNLRHFALWMNIDYAALTNTFI